VCKRVIFYVITDNDLFYILTNVGTYLNLIIWSTSLPWNPTSVYLVASTLINGACESFAILLAISVFPQPNIYKNNLK